VTARTDSGLRHGRLGPMLANMRAFYRLLGERSPDGSVAEHPAVLGSIVPSCPRRSIVNAVVYEDGSALADAYDAIAAAYDSAGVLAWTVWVPESEPETGRFLSAAGHKLDARPRAMLAELRALDLESPDGLEWERTDDVAAIASINEAAYGLPAGEFGPAMTAFKDAEIALYLARVGGEPMACLGALSAGGDCGIYLVATLPAARGRGLASGLMRQALRDARDSGCTTSSLQATKAGFPVYERLGYRDVCAIDMWERRRPESGVG
jgi:GNAT superfamily N-acetyltransferase